MFKISSLMTDIGKKRDSVLSYEKFGLNVGVLGSTVKGLGG